MGHIIQLEKIAECFTKDGEKKEIISDTLFTGLISIFFLGAFTLSILTQGALNFILDFDIFIYSDRELINTFFVIINMFFMGVIIVRIAHSVIVCLAKSVFKLFTIIKNGVNKLCLLV